MVLHDRDRLAGIRRFDQLIAYLRDELNWPIDSEDFEELTFEYTPEELGIDLKNAAKIQEIKRLRPLTSAQPWGIFFVKFEPKTLPVVALRRILSQVVLKRRASANAADRRAWAADDLLFISNYGAGEQRQISLAHFSAPAGGRDLPTLKVLGWNNLNTGLHLDAVAGELREHLTWPENESDSGAWRARWRAAFTLRHRETITTSRELSIRLAELARDIRDLITTALAIETDEGPLTKLMKAFQAALVHDLDAAGFADMYAQTIAYGLLSARIADPHSKTADDFAAHMRTNPFLRELMETFLKVGGRRGKAGGPGIDFDELGVSQVIDLLDDANMEAVVRNFGDKNPQEDPVIHFYEGFAKEYDPIDKVRRGEFYTPRPVVSYIVRSVDEMLRTEFGLADGLADTTTWGEMAKRHKDLKIPEGVSPEQDFVQILDPATGTGTFLVEVIDLIHKTLVAKWKAQGHGERKIDALWNEYVPKHLLKRLHAYELKMAPYAIAHLKVGLKLYETGYRFGSDERAHVYLTNALEPAQAFSGTFEFAIPALAHEAQAVNEIKRRRRFTVVVGNPPYAGISSNMSDAAQQMVDAYKLVDGAPLGERKLWLQDDYVKFTRKAQLIVERTGAGVFSFITNHSYLDNPTFRGMRQSLMATFPRLRVLDLHGNANKREQSPDGSDDKNVFDIRQGVAVCLATRGPLAPLIGHADLWGPRAAKYEWLNAHAVGNTDFEELTPSSPFYFLEPQSTDYRGEYDSGIKLTDAMPCFGLGFQSSRDHLVVGFTREELQIRIERFLSPHLPDGQIRAEFFPGKVVANYLAGDTRQWSLAEARRTLRTDESWKESIRPCLYRPFDWRSILYDKRMVDWPRPEVLGHMLKPNLALLANRQSKEDFAVLCTNVIAERKIAAVYDASSSFPLYLQPVEHGLALRATRQPNFSPAFLRALATKLAVEQSEPHGLPIGVVPEDIFNYVYAIFHSHGYRGRYAEFLTIDFPRLPLPGSLGLLSMLSRLGGGLVALHLLESPKLDCPITEHLGGRARAVEKVSWSRNTVWIDKAQTSGFKGVREDVWNFHIGGYQVCNKWLKDRKGRTLSKDDIAHYQKIVVALSETIRLMKEIDEVIEQHGGWPTAFQSSDSLSEELRLTPEATQAALFRQDRTAAPGPRLTLVEPQAGDRYVTCVPLVPLKVAAGAFGDPQHADDSEFQWVAVDTTHRLRPGMFVAQVIGKSMEPAIPNGSYCLFRAPVEGSRQGKTVLVQLLDERDPETGERYTVKRYESDKAKQGDVWRHTSITLKPTNPAFAPIELTHDADRRLRVIAELIEVLGASDLGDEA